MKRECLTNNSSSESYAHAVEALELRSVLEHIASKCVNDGAKNLISSLRPTTERTRIEESLAEIEELCGYRAAAGNLPIVDTTPQRWIRGARERSDAIPAEGLLAIAAIERSVHELQRRVGRDEPLYPRLAGIVSQMAPAQSLVDDIERCIDSDGTLKDRASPKLHSLRRSARRARDDIRSHSDRLAKSLGSADYATFSGTRYLLLVPRDKCRRREGIVHATSHSGGSLYFEPFSLVEKNNSLETLLLDERAEQTRILTELTTRVVEISEGLLENIRVWERLDALNATAMFAVELGCRSPVVSEDGLLRLAKARHPLLELSLREKQSAHSLVPLDLHLDRTSRVLVITGPNAGGKTVTLKTVGLLSLMLQCGLPIPCDEGTALIIFDTVFADIGDEQSIESSLSTFTSHLRHLDLMCRTAGQRTLCLVDEIGDGTDPEEGSALAIATLERLVSLEAVVVATTHYGKVKSFALDTEGVSNASMLFDDQNDRPLYRLLQGMAGRSRGIETARRMSFFEPVIKRAQSMLGKDTFRLETLLSELESSKLALERERQDMGERSVELRRLVESYGSKERELREHKALHQKRARQETEEMLFRARKEIEAIVKDIRESAAAKSSIRSGHARLQKLLDEVRPREPLHRAGDVTVGERVSLSPSGDPAGRVIAVKKDLVTVDIKGKKLNVKKASLFRVEEETSDAETQVDVNVHVEPLRVTTIDVRGKDREEALSEVDLFVDRAVLNGVHEVTIIHGVGEEILLGAIQAQLQDDSRVKSFRTGRTGEGGRGVSIVELN
ncbi:MAG: Smr/MutS family protein [Candidatus Krumholzibacteria bacterium]|nr:Smr/MutS family protein [Candidatus Krumholzibacteria bacterium]